jgi:hypothetical protein
MGTKTPRLVNAAMARLAACAKLLAVQQHTLRSTHLCAVALASGTRACVAELHLALEQLGAGAAHPGHHRLGDLACRGSQINSSSSGINTMTGTAGRQMTTCFEASSSRISNTGAHYS